MKRRWPILIMALLLSNAITAAMAGWYAWQTRVQHLQVQGQAAFLGETVAIEDLQAGRQRILQPVRGLGSLGVAPTGRREGRFSVWTWPMVVTGEEDATGFAQMFTDAYNNRMRLMVNHPHAFQAGYEHLSPHAEASSSPR